MKTMDTLKNPPKITTGKKAMPPAVFLYGVEGIGKTSFAQRAPHVFFLGDEKNDEFEFPRHSCESYDEFLAYLGWFECDTKHGYKTIVIDTIDGVERLLHKKIAGDKTMATACGGYGRAYDDAFEKMQAVISKLDQIREKGYGVIILGHCAKIKTSDPLTPDTDYDTYQPNLHSNAKGKGTLALFTAWASCVLFANYRVGTVKEDGGKQYVAGLGERRMFTEKRPGYVAKNRFNLPHEMELDYLKLMGKIRTHYKTGVQNNNGNTNSNPSNTNTSTTSEFRQVMTDMLAQVKDQSIIPKIKETIDKVEGNAAKEAKAKARLQTIIKGQ